MSSLRRNILHVPSKGFIRFRHWLGVGEEQIAKEVLQLHLPGYSVNAEAVVAGVLADAPKPPASPHLEVLDGGKSAKTEKAKKKASRPALKMLDVLVEAYDASRDDDAMYVAENRLDYYAGSDAGRAAVRNALELWCEAGTLRELTIDGLLAGDTPAEIGEVVRRHAPNVMRKNLRNVDITAFRDLFWDFRGISPPDVAAFVVSYPTSLHAPLAIAQGSRAVRQRMGLESYPYSAVSSKHMLEQILGGWLEHQMLQPEKTKINELVSAAQLVEMLQELKTAGGGGGAEAMQKLRQVGPKLLSATPIPSLIEMMSETTAHQRTEDVEYALSLGAITQEEYADFLRQIDEGIDFGSAVRDKIRAMTETDDDEDQLSTPNIGALAKAK